MLLRRVVKWRIVCVQRAAAVRDGRHFLQMKPLFARKTLCPLLCGTYYCSNVSCAVFVSWPCKQCCLIWTWTRCAAVCCAAEQIQGRARSWTFLCNQKTSGYSCAVKQLGKEMQCYKIQPSTVKVEFKEQKGRSRLGLRGWRGSCHKDRAKTSSSSSSSSHSSFNKKDLW